LGSRSRGEIGAKEIFAEITRTSLNLIKDIDQYSQKSQQTDR
jgi:hypothetical protein